MKKSNYEETETIILPLALSRTDYDFAIQGEYNSLLREQKRLKERLKKAKNRKADKKHLQALEDECNKLQEAMSSLLSRLKIIFVQKDAEDGFTFKKKRLGPSRFSLDLSYPILLKGYSYYGGIPVSREIRYIPSSREAK